MAAQLQHLQGAAKAAGAAFSSLIYFALHLSPHMQYHGIVLAGAFLWDKPLEYAMPRALLPVCRVPLVCYSLCWLDRAGVSRATLCLNSHARQFRRCLANGSLLNMELDYYEDHTPRGPAGCARDAAECSKADVFVVVDGSLLLNVDLRAFLDAHHSGDAGMSVLIQAARNGNGRPGGVEGDPCGVYVISREALSHVPAIGFQDIKETFIPRLHAAGVRVAAYHCNEPLLCINSLDSYLRANSWVLQRLCGEHDAPEGYHRSADGIVHATATIDPGARLSGRLLIGEQTRIERGAMIIGPAVIGSNCILREDVVVSRSVLLDDVEVERGARIDHSVIFHHETVGPGRILLGRFGGSAQTILGASQNLVASGY